MPRMIVEAKKNWLDRKRFLLGSSDPLATKKRIASTEMPRGFEEGRAERDLKRRETLMAKACKLREQLGRVEKELDPVIIIRLIF